MSDDFSNPGSTLNIPWKDYEGQLLLINVHKVETDIQSQYGKGDAIRADVNILDGPTAGEGYAQTLVWPKVLQGQLRPMIGRKVLGRLGKGEARSGQSAPWKLDDPTDADKAIARQHLADQAASRSKPPF